MMLIVSMLFLYNKVYLDIIDEMENNFPVLNRQKLFILLFIVIWNSYRSLWISK